MRRLINGYKLLGVHGQRGTSFVPERPELAPRKKNRILGAQGRLRGRGQVKGFRLGDRTEAKERLAVQDSGEGLVI
jgi:hypothetical protein